jgi:hypothetical protein
VKDSVSDLAAYDMKPIDRDAWHRLGVLVNGPSVEVWFDGKKVITWRDPSGAGLTGHFGVFQQSCRTERRVFRVAKVD